MKRMALTVAVAVMSALVSAIPAAADQVSTTTGGTAATPTIHAVNEGGHVVLSTPAFNVSCNSTVEGTVESHGGGIAASGNLATLTFTSCTNSWHVTTITAGSLSVEWTTGHNGKLFSTGARVDLTRSGGTCVYETNNTPIGTVTGGNPATLHIEASIPLSTSESSGWLCGTSSAKWEGSYVTTSPLYVANTVPSTIVTTTTGGAPETPTVHAANEGGHVTLQNPIANISCSSTAEGKVENHGSGIPASGALSVLTFTSCTNSWHVTTIKAGSLSVVSTGGHNGTLTSSGAKIDTTRFGVKCVYETASSGTPVGTLTGGSPATLDIEAQIPINTSESSGLCGASSAKWEGSYVTTSALYVDSP